MKQSDIVKKLIEGIPEYYDLESIKLRNSEYYRAYETGAHEAHPIKVAMGFSEFLMKKPVIISENDILAGLLQHYDVTSSGPVVCDDGYDPRVQPVYARRTDVKRIIDECVLFLDANDDQARYMYGILKGCESGLLSHNPYGHVIPGFDKVIGSGFDALLVSIRKRLESISSYSQKDYLRAMEIVITAASSYFVRYCDAAKKKAETAASEIARSNLLRIAETCLRVSHAPAESFFDAVQMATLLQELFTIETASGSMSLGRMDQLFYTYYKKDVREQKITAHEAQCIIDAWRIKLAGLKQGFQNTVICGCTEDGGFAGNDVSLMILNSSRRLRFDQPLLSIRYTKDMPDNYWDEALKLIEMGDGFPALFNDEVIIASREEMGVSPEHSWNYGIVGCVEPSIQGMEFSNTEQLRINWMKLLELMLSGGECVFTGNNFTLCQKKELTQIDSFNDFLAWFKAELVHLLKQAAKGCDLIDSVYHKAFPSPMLSVTMEGCIENACDVADKVGTVYRYSTINNCAMSNVVDSLLAVKKIVFEERLLSLIQLKEVLDADFEGFEEIRQFTLGRCEKFGNDTPEANQLMAELIDLASQTINGIPNCRGFHFQTGMYSVDMHASFGMVTCASPDGRKKGVSLASGLSPVQGADKRGPTAVINAVTAFDHRQIRNGMVLDIKFNPSMFRNLEHRNKLRMLIEAYFNKGGMEIQFNVIDKMTLLDAQKNPEKHQNLIVRVSGFSAYYVNLYKILQDEIIARTENENY